MLTSIYSPVYISQWGLLHIHAFYHCVLSPYLFYLLISVCFNDDLFLTSILFCTLPFINLPCLLSTFFFYLLISRFFTRPITYFQLYYTGYTRICNLLKQFDISKQNKINDLFFASVVWSTLPFVARSAAVQSPRSATISQLNKDDRTAFLFLYVFLFTKPTYPNRPTPTPYTIYILSYTCKMYNVHTSFTHIMSSCRGIGFPNPNLYIHSVYMNLFFGG